jgi:hypothetical protein
VLVCVTAGPSPSLAGEVSPFLDFRSPPTISMSHNEVANAFVTHYYQTFDQSVMNLAALYVSLGCVAWVWHVRL